MTSAFKPKIVSGQVLNTQVVDTQALESPLAKVLPALAQKTEKEALRMLPSLAQEVAKNSWQAELDLHRASEALRVTVALGHQVTETVAANDVYVAAQVAAHPDRKADFTALWEGINDLGMQLPTATGKGLLRLFFERHTSVDDY